MENKRKKAVRALILAGWLAIDGMKIDYPVMQGKMTNIICTMTFMERTANMAAFM